MNRHTKRMIVTILLAVLFGVSGVVSSIAGASLIEPPLAPTTKIIQNS